MKRHREFSSTVKRNKPSGDTARRQTLDDDCTGRVMVWDFIRSVTDTRFPTGEISCEFWLMTTLPPL